MIRVVFRGGQPWDLSLLFIDAFVQIVNQDIIALQDRNVLTLLQLQLLNQLILLRKAFLQMPNHLLIFLHRFLILLGLLLDPLSLCFDLIHLLLDLLPLVFSFLVLKLVFFNLLLLFGHFRFHKLYLVFHDRHFLGDPFILRLRMHLLVLHFLDLLF